jgi:hypothetical protein
MTRQEIIYCRFAEFMDLLSCYAIYNGDAKERKKMSFDDALNLR